MRGRMVSSVLVALALVGSLYAVKAAASVDVDINLIAPPQLVAVPGTPVAYAPAVPANYFFYAGRYYVFGDGTWFVARGYNGPFVALAPAYVPPALLTVPVYYYPAAPWQWRHWHRGYPPRWAPAWGRHWSRDWRDHDHGPHRGDHRRDGHDDGHRDRPRGDHRRDRH